MTQLLHRLAKVVTPGDGCGETTYRWDGRAGESATGYENGYGRGSDRWVSAKLHPFCRPVTVSGPEADSLFNLGRNSTESLSFAVGAWLGATEHLLQQRSA